MLAGTPCLDRELAKETGKSTGAALRGELDRFLASVERRALVIAEMSIRDRDEAMDVVQDAMIRLVRKYADRPSEEWTPLFYRILSNRVRDLQRRRAVRNRVMSWFGGSGEDEADPIANAVDTAQATPGEELEAMEMHEALTAAVARLPRRQREAFALRSLEGLDTAQTAKAMACSEGSVKTHYSRALATLKASLQGYEL